MDKKLWQKINLVSGLFGSLYPLLLDERRPRNPVVAIFQDNPNLTDRIWRAVNEIQSAHYEDIRVTNELHTEQNLNEPHLERIARLWKERTESFQQLEYAYKKARELEDEMLTKFVQWCLEQREVEKEAREAQEEANDDPIE